MIHKTAIIGSTAKIGKNVKVGPYSIIGPNVEIGEGSEIQSHVSIIGDTKREMYNKIYPFNTLVLNSINKVSSSRLNFLVSFIFFKKLLTKK